VNRGYKKRQSKNKRGEEEMKIGGGSPAKTSVGNAGGGPKHVFGDGVSPETQKGGGDCHSHRYGVVREKPQNNL